MLLDESSFAYLVLRHWGPPIVTIVVGGLFASVLFPRWQARWSRERAVGERKVALYEGIAENFSLYVTAWRRLIQISGLQRQRELSEREMLRKDQYLAQRTDARDALVCEFAKARLYFSAKSRGRIDSFLGWDETNGAKQLEDLPQIAEWKRWEEEIVRCLRDEL